MKPAARAANAFAAVAVGSLAAVGIALYTQYRLGMQPCPWCVLQRLIFVTLAAACGLGFVWRSAAGRRVAGLVALALAFCGMAAALWQHFRAAASASCNLTLADRITSQWLGLDSLWPEVFAPRASCADAAVDLLGMPYDFWSFAAFLIAAVTVGAAMRAPEEAGGFSFPA